MVTAIDSNLPFFSIVVPVRNGGADFERCLAALTAGGCVGHELIVVDDGSGDGSGEAARRAGAAVVLLPASGGPAAARNRGAARARGRYLFFLDADCEIHQDTLGLAERFLAEHPAVGAVFGSYDDAPAAGGLVSRFKNLLHHWVHQRAAGPAQTFWAGCGAVRRDHFLAVGGFDERRFRRPSIEDIDLGYRLGDAGVAIELLPEMQVKHLKHWRLRSLIETDVRARAAPWTRLLLERGRTDARELNLDARARASVALTALVPPAALLAALDLRLGALAAALPLLGVLALNLSLYRFFFRRGGLLGAASVPLHLLYCGYSGVGMALGCLEHLAGRWRAERPAGAV